MPIFQRLAQYFKRLLAEFRQLVKKEHAMMRKRHLTGTWDAPAADHRHHRGCMMRTAERTLFHQTRILTKEPGNAVNLRYLDGLFLRQLRQNRTHSTRQHRLARTGHTDHQDIMPTRRCNLKCTLRLILPLHIGKVIGKGIVSCGFDWFWHGGCERFRTR